MGEIFLACKQYLNNNAALRTSLATSFQKPCATTFQTVGEYDFH